MVAKLTFFLKTSSSEISLHLCPRTLPVLYNRHLPVILRLRPRDPASSKQIFPFEFLVFSFPLFNLSQMSNYLKTYPLLVPFPSRNGRFRISYLYDPSTCFLSGTVQCDVHYYEDGNVRLTTRKSINPTTVPPSSSSLSSTSTSSATAVEIVKAIASLEGKYQKDLNHGFAKLSEGEFKALRRQLPVTRQKVEWEKIGGYRVSSNIHSASQNNFAPQIPFPIFFS